MTIELGRLGQDKIYESKPGRIFVFGSNTVGRHGAGAAKAAVLAYGAIYGQGRGLQGGSYAIPTKDHNLRTLALDVIKTHVVEFLDFAKDHPQLKFFVTRIGCGLAGYKDHHIAVMFKGSTPNIELPYGWYDLAEGNAP